MGVGMVALVAAADADRALEVLAEQGVAAWRCGEVLDITGGEVELVGDYRSV
jgi:phosphoribosylformylglycinamidine cyclo-ligase